MSKRSSTSDNPTNYPGPPNNAPIAKKPRIDMNDTLAEVGVKATQLLDAMKAQKAAVQWGHTTCRDDTLANITKMELLISSLGELSKKSKEQVIVLSKIKRREVNFQCSICGAVDRLIDALVESEIIGVGKVFNKYQAMDVEYGPVPEISIVEGIQQYQHSIEDDVKEQLKEKLKNLTTDEAIKKVKAEVKGAYKAAALKRIAGILDRVLA